MTESDRKAVDRRLARIEGQVRGLRRLVEEDAYCCDILQQLTAVTSALNQVSASIASGHIKHCIIGHGTEAAHGSTKAMSRDDLVEELDEVLSRMMR